VLVDERRAELVRRELEPEEERAGRFRGGAHRGWAGRSVARGGWQSVRGLAQGNELKGAGVAVGVVVKEGTAQDNGSTKTKNWARALHPPRACMQAASCPVGGAGPGPSFLRVLDRVELVRELGHVVLRAKGQRRRGTKR
jgi:hypothetical protein